MSTIVVNRPTGVQRKLANGQIVFNPVYIKCNLKKRHQEVFHQPWTMPGGGGGDSIMKCPDVCVGGLEMEMCPLRRTPLVKKTNTHIEGILFFLKSFIYTVEYRN